MSTIETGQATEAQSAMMQAKPQKEHQWLDKLVGEWTFEVEVPPRPGAAPEKATGSERVRSLGGLWVVAEGQGEMPGAGPTTTIMTLGYDPKKGHYLGTWIGSMMTHMWIYRGTLDAGGKALTLDTEGPSMVAEGKMAKYRETMRFESDAHRVFTSEMLGDDGQWQPVMTTHYRRKN